MRVLCRKGADGTVAIDRAVVAAMKNLVYVDFHDGNSLWEPLVGKKNSTKAILLPPGKKGGITVCLLVFFVLWFTSPLPPYSHTLLPQASPLIATIASSYGIENLRARIVGRKSLNPYIAVSAVFDALQSYRTLEEVARGRGIHVHDLKHIAPNRIA